MRTLYLLGGGRAEAMWPRPGATALARVRRADRAPPPAQPVLNATPPRVIGGSRGHGPPIIGATLAAWLLLDGQRMPKASVTARGKLRFVDVETARAARGVRLALLAGLPSPWSDGARALFATKGIDVLAVRYLPGDTSVTGWTGVPNAPAVMVDDERARSGWAEIIALGERLGPARPLVPPGPAARARMFGLLHELLDEGGVAWSRRLLILDESFRPEDPARPRRAFPLPIAQGLAARYGYAPERVPAARARLLEALVHLDGELRAVRDGAAAGGPYFFGATLTALDLYAAAVTAVLVPPDEALRPIMPVLRPIFDYLDPEVADAVTPALRAHRDWVYAHHIRDEAE